MYPQVLKNGEEQPTVSVPTQQDMESMTEYVAEWVAVRHNSWGDTHRYLLTSAKEFTAEQREQFGLNQVQYGEPVSFIGVPCRSRAEGLLTGAEMTMTQRQLH